MRSRSRLRLSLPQTVIGTTFQWGDLVAYAVGALVAVVLAREAAAS